MTNDVLIIFMRAPVRGQVKTRLATSIGDEAALSVYRSLLEHTRQVALQINKACHLYITGGQVTNEEWADPPFRKFDQCTGDLGDRMKNSFERTFGAGVQKAVVIGTDCYELTPGILERAFHALNQHDIVLGPAHDGGYYLMGMKKLHPALFANKNWGSSSVYQDTMEDIRKMKLSVGTLDKLHDIDTPEDLERSELKNYLPSSTK